MAPNVVAYQLVTAGPQDTHNELGTCLGLPIATALSGMDFVSDVTECGGSSGAEERTHLSHRIGALEHLNGLQRLVSGVRSDDIEGIAASRPPSLSGQPEERARETV